jgi:hypothetical protein
MRGHRTFDWRFFVALAACLMVAYLVVGGYQDNVRKGQRIDRLIAAGQAADARAAHDAANASTERQALLANQDRLLRLYRHQVRRQERLDARLTNLLAYLRAQGIAVPAEFQTGKRPGRRGGSRPELAPPTGKSPGKAHQGKAPGATATAPGPDILGPVTDLLHLLTKGTP